MPHRPSYAMYLGGCRCDGCRAAAIDSYRAKRVKEKESERLSERIRTRHGTEKSYNLGCRCETCEVAQEVREEVKRRRSEKRQREDWVNKLTFANLNDEGNIEVEDDLTEEEIETAVFEEHATESELDFSQILK